MTNVLLKGAKMKISCRTYSERGWATCPFHCEKIQLVLRLSALRVYKITCSPKLRLPAFNVSTAIMSSFVQHGNDGEEIQPPQRPPSPPPHTTFAVRGVHVRLVSPSTFERCSHDRGLPRRHRLSPLFGLVTFVSRLRSQSHTFLGAAMERSWPQ